MSSGVMVPEAAFATEHLDGARPLNVVKTENYVLQRWRSSRPQRSGDVQ